MNHLFKKASTCYHFTVTLFLNKEWNTEFEKQNIVTYIPLTYNNKENLPYLFIFTKSVFQNKPYQI